RGRALGLEQRFPTQRMELGRFGADAQAEPQHEVLRAGARARLRERRVEVGIGEETLSQQPSVFSVVLLDEPKLVWVEDHGGGALLADTRIVIRRGVPELDDEPVGVAAVEPDLEIGTIHRQTPDNPAGDLFGDCQGEQAGAYAVTPGTGP